MSQDAVWVPGQPLAVNRDFDFAVAMSMDAIGPGLAAKKRRDANLALAKKLAALPPLDPHTALQALCEAPPRTACAQLAGKHVRLYGLLFGERNARLRVTLEVDTADDTANYASVTEATAIDALLEPTVLSRLFTRAAARIATGFASTDTPNGAVGTCNAGDGAKLQGKVITATADHALLLVTETKPTRIVCPASAFESPQPDEASQAPVPSDSIP